MSREFGIPVPSMTQKEDDERGPLDPGGVGICTRILNDTVAQLAVRYGVSTVVFALTEIVGCSSCLSDAGRDANLHSLVDKLGRK